MIWLPPLALAFSWLVVWWAAFSAPFPSDSSAPQKPLLDLFMQGDAGHYLSIARDGYSLISCRQVPGYPPEEWCGNAGWLPGYPILLRISYGLFIEPIQSFVSLPQAMVELKMAHFGLFLSLVLCLTTLFLVLKSSSTENERLKPTLIVLMAAVFPGVIYHLALFPMSLIVLGSLITLTLCCQGRSFASGLVGGLTAFSYSTGFLLAPTLALASITGNNDTLKEKAKGLITPALVSLGFIATLIYFQFTVDNWRAFFMVQEKYGHGVHSPITTLIHQLAPIWNGSNQSKFPALQSGLVLVMMVLAGLLVVFSRQKLNRLDQLILAHCSILWLFPLIMGQGVSLYRAESLLLPLVIPLRHLPNSALIPLVTIAVWLHFKMTQLFFAGILI